MCSRFPLTPPRTGSRAAPGARRAPDPGRHAPPGGRGAPGRRRQPGSALGGTALPACQPRECPHGRHRPSDRGARLDAPESGRRCLPACGSGPRCSSTNPHLMASFSAGISCAGTRHGRRRGCTVGILQPTSSTTGASIRRCARGTGTSPATSSHASRGPGRPSVL